jgi:PTS system mannose-specific IIB component/fructoselysine and glucoselysine-specific PTS system IIB component
VALTLFRIDERLLHGQVLVGWGVRLGIDHYIVVDDALAESAWEQELYAGGLTEGGEALFLGLTEAINQFEELDQRVGRGALLTRGTVAMRHLAESGLLWDRCVNIGGLHSARDRSQALDYVFLGEADVDDLLAMEPLVHRISARDLPTAPEISLEQILRSVGRP